MSEVQRIKRDLNRWSRKLLLCLGLETIGKSLVGEENWKELYPVDKDWDDNRLILSDFDPNDLPQQLELDDEDSEFNTEPNTFYSSSTPPALGHQGEPSTTTEDDEPNGENNELLENFIHLLPYWYFLRAFGVGVPPGNGLENISGDLSGAHPSGLESLDAQRLHSLLFLHSLKQQQLQLQAGETEGLDFTHQLRNMPFLFAEHQQEMSNGFPENMGSRNNDSPFIHNPLQHGSYFGPVSPENDLDQPLDLTKKNKFEKPYDERNNLITRNDLECSRNSDDLGCENQIKSIIRSTNRGGRAYTSENLEAALIDIQSGHLGTRRAAVKYGIPRSTLRNKVYKLGKFKNGADKRDDGTKPAKVVPSPSFTNAVSPRNGRESNNVDSRESGNFDRLNCIKNGDCPDDELTEDDIEVKSEGEISDQKKYFRNWLQCRKESRSMLASKVHEKSLRSGSVFNNENSSCEETSDLNNDSENEEQRRKRRRTCILPNDSYRMGSSSNSFPQIELDWGNLRSRNAEDCSMDESELDSRSRSNRGSSGHNFCLSQDQPMTSSFMTDSNEKKSRPKRGKYRNYDREALLKAVKAVQIGKMTVHKAGSHFGVPHSTLEYKVKERHLLRRPKKKSTSTLQKNSPDSSLSGSDPLPSTQNDLQNTNTYASEFPNSIHRKSHSSKLYETSAGEIDSTDLRSNNEDIETEQPFHHVHSLSLDELIRKNLNNGKNHVMNFSQSS